MSAKESVKNSEIFINFLMVREKLFLAASSDTIVAEAASIDAEIGIIIE